MRFYFADPGLRANIGHHANGCRHIVQEARARGIESHVLAHKDVEESLRASLQARPFFQAYTYVFSDGDPYCGWLSGFHKAAAATLEDLGQLKDVGRDDVVFFHGAMPAQLSAAVEWVQRLPDNKCPLVIVELAAEPGVDAESEGTETVVKIPNPQIDARATLFRFIALGMERIKDKPLRVITYNADVSSTYSQLMGRGVGVLPFPTPADTKLRNRAGRRPVVISVLGHQQFRKGYHLMPAVVEHVLRTRRDSHFLIHNSDPLQVHSAGHLMRDVQETLKQMADADPRVQIEARAVEFEEWVGLLDRSDLILCPYDPARYAHGHSGLASMAIANGIPLVVPGGTPLSRWLARFDGPGVAFETFSESAVIAALESALDNFDLYAERAFRAAERWSEINGPNKFIDAVLGLAEQRKKNGLPEVVRIPEPQLGTVGPIADSRPRKGPATTPSSGKRHSRPVPPFTGASSVFALNTQGIGLAANGEFALALESFDAALRCVPTCAESWFYRGMTLETLARPVEAYECFAQAVMLAPNYTDAEARLAALATQVNRSAAVLTSWMKDAAPGVAARTRHRLRRLLGKRDSYQPVYRDPDEATLRSRLLADSASSDDAAALGRVLLRQDRVLESELFFRYAVRLEPWNGEAIFGLCAALEAQPPKAPQIKKIISDALAAGASDDRLAHIALWANAGLGDWSDYDALLQQVLASFARTPSSVPAFCMLHYTDDPQVHKVCASAFFEKGAGDATPISVVFPKHEGRKLTIGYLSPDFRNHALAYLCPELIELHDRKRITPVAFSLLNGELGDAGRRLRRAFDSFHDLCGMSVEAAAKKIAQANVDILVDLTGHAAHARPGILAARPAPIVVNYLGFPGTLGSRAVDYIIVDKVIASKEDQQWYSEALVQMPGSYQINDRKRSKGSGRLTRAGAGLPERGMVFCCFNELRKVSPGVFRTWMNILQRVPDSVLWLYTANPLAQENLRREVECAGVTPERIVFATKLDHADHLSRYKLADLFLDTQPYGAHTTGSDALWIGCPVLTLRGNAFAGRVGASLLTAVGLPELITSTWQEYEDLAVRLGTDREMLREYRRKLERTGPQSRLFDSPRFTRQLEWAYSEMWRRYLSDQEPQGFEVPDIS